MSRRLLQSLLLAIPLAGAAAWGAGADPLMDGDLVAVVPNTSVTTPDMELFAATGHLEGWFFSPFVPADIAVDHAGRVVFGATDSGTLVLTDAIGSLVALVPTPASHVDGVAVAPSGNLFVLDGNTLYRLSPNGQLVDATVLPVTPTGPYGGGTPLAADGDDGVAFPVAPTSGIGSYGVGLLDLGSQVLSTVPTTLYSIAGLDVAANGEIVAVGKTSYTGPNTISRFDRRGLLLGQITGPAGVTSIAVANLPEPAATSAALAGWGALALRARLRRARRSRSA